MIRKPFLFLDRDGIINEVVIREGRIESPRSVDEFVIRNEFINFYSKLHSLNCSLFIVSNQPDIARGIMDYNVLDNINQILRSEFVFNDILYCTHDDSDKCSCRKPKPGLINSLIEQYSLSKDDSLILGDSWKDIECGKRAGIKTILLNTEYNKTQKCLPDYSINNLDQLLQVDIWS
jgi:D-glycero-D-manno-heptose 1,7-bisphosphate phosphatase